MAVFGLMISWSVATWIPDSFWSPVVSGPGLTAKFTILAAVGAALTLVLPFLRETDLPRRFVLGQGLASAIMIGLAWRDGHRVSLPESWGLGSLTSHSPLLVIFPVAVTAPVLIGLFLITAAAAVGVSRLQIAVENRNWWHEVLGGLACVAFFVQLLLAIMSVVITAIGNTWTPMWTIAVAGVAAITVLFLGIKYRREIVEVVPILAMIAILYCAGVGILALLGWLLMPLTPLFAWIQSCLEPIARVIGVITVGGFVVVLILGLAIWWLNDLFVRWRYHIWLALRKFRQVNVFSIASPNEWKEHFEKADPFTQEMMILSTTYSSLQLTPRAFHQLLESCEQKVQMRAAGTAYWRARHELEELLRQERTVTLPPAIAVSPQRGQGEEF
jgi:hypothetical protein